METKTINLIVSRGWHELDDKQLRYFWGLLANDYTSANYNDRLILCELLQTAKQHYISPNSDLSRALMR